MQKCIFFILLFCISLSGFSGTVIVTNTNDSGAGSLRASIASASAGDTIRFSPSLIAGGSDTIKLNSVITINKTLFIKGLATVLDTLFIKSPSTNYSFDIDLSVGLIKSFFFESICIVNGGGGINFNGDSLKIVSSFFGNHNRTVINAFNQSTVNSRDILVSINKTEFIDNSETITSSSSLINVFNISSSSLIRSVTATTSLIDCQLMNNRYDGRLLSCKTDIPHSVPTNTCSSRIIIKSSKIIGNTSNGTMIVAETYGVADSVVNTSTIDVSESEIEFNTTNIRFSTLLSLAQSFSPTGYSSGKINADNTTFQNNSGTPLNARIIFVEKCTFFKNRGQYAGAIRSYGGLKNWSTSYNSYVRVLNSTFSHNTSTDTLNPGCISSSTAFVSGLKKIEIGGSIFFKNGEKQFKSDVINSVISKGYNICNDSSINAPLPSDFLSIDSLSLKLDRLKYNGNKGKTMAPLRGSIAINNGNPLDLSNAQNKPIDGIRDIGSAESRNCFAKFVPTQTSAGEVVLLDSTMGNHLKYTWYFGDGDSSNSYLPTHTYNSAGTYYVCLKIQDTVGFCSDIFCDSITVDTSGVLRNSWVLRVVRTIVSLEETKVEMKLLIFPNPSTGNFTLDLGKPNQLTRIFITDINGRLIKEVIPQNISKYEIYLEGAPGVYFLNIVGENDRKTVKIIKQ